MLTRLLPIALLLLIIAACEGDDGPEVRPPRTGDTAESDAAETDAGAADSGDRDVSADSGGGDANPTDTDVGEDTAPLGPGGELYNVHCERCHGERGEGGVGLPIDNWTDGRDALVIRIDETMPTGQAGDCVGECAHLVADHVLSFERPSNLDCTEPTYGARQLRLLNRREYDNTLRDLLGLTESCTVDSTCPSEAPICDGGRCSARPCGLTEFVYDPRGRDAASVLVAGSFNSWAGTVEAGGWPMREGGDGMWRLETTLEPGTHGYKYVVDGTDWFPDPDASRFEDDGFGGQNSLIDVDCSESSDPLAGLTGRFPPEVRPTDFGFDTHADTARVTSTHVVEYMTASERAADLVVDRIGEITGCTGRSACEMAFLDEFAPRVFRRPLTSDERGRYLAQLESESNGDDGMRLAARTLFTSPNFLYRTEVGEDIGGGVHRLTDWEIASALSYTFWGTTPDRGLHAAAASGGLSDATGIAEQARRLLRDPRARDVVGVFAVQWLGVESILTANKSPALFPEVDDTLRAAMLDETRRFVTHVVFDGTGQFDELLEADYTFANARLAAIYGLDASGADLSRTPYALGLRAGVLGHASVLGTYAHSDQTSPIRRGLFVRQHLLCQDFGEPPPNAGGVPEVDASASTRERFAQHTADPFCASCHQYIDDLGFGLEGFDAVGRHRTTDGGFPIDSSGDMNDLEGLGVNTSAPFDGVRELSTIIAESHAARECFVRQFYRFARGHREDDEAHDSSASRECAVEAITAEFGESGYDIIEMMVAAVTTDDFLLRR